MIAQLNIILLQSIRRNKYYHTNTTNASEKKNMIYYHDMQIESIYIAVLH